MKSTSDHFRYNKSQELTASCRLNGLPVTPQRQAILEVLAARTDHPSADELYDEVRKRLRGISRTTVYRVLDTLVKIGVIQKIGTQEARARFDADTRRHPHVLCIGCGKLADLHDIKIEELMPDQPLVDGFHLFNYAIHFTGLCGDCLSHAEPQQPLPSRPHPKETP